MNLFAIAGSLLATGASFSVFSITLGLTIYQSGMPVPNMWFVMAVLFLIFGAVLVASSTYGILRIGKIQDRNLNEIAERYERALRLMKPKRKRSLKTRERAHKT